MAEQKPGWKPSVVWLEGVLDYFNTPFPHADPDDPRQVGFNVGRQVIGLYLAELLLKYALDDDGVWHRRNHNLYELFRQLARPRRRRVEEKYTEILTSRRRHAWDHERTVDELLKYLGDDPMTDSRYFWERPHTGEISILIAVETVYALVYALFIALHRYPERGPKPKPIGTVFQSFEESLPDEDKPGRGLQDP